MPKNSRFPWREFWKLIRPYWSSEERWSARALLAVIIGMNLGSVYLNVLFNQWNRLFYNAVQKLDFPAFKYQLFRFCVLAAIFIVIAVYQIYLNRMLQIRWRRWMTERYLDSWLKGRMYYQLQLRGGATDNPDQRISEDLRSLVSLTLDLGLGVLSSVVTLFSFLAILWRLSGPAHFVVFGLHVYIPGYMLWAALVYAILGTWLTHLVGRPLIRLNFDQQRYEADFRFSMMRLRENAEAVALYGGEGNEHEEFRRRFAWVYGNWWKLMVRQMKLSWLTSGYSQIAVVFPFIVAAPRYFAKQIQLGGLMQTASAFGQVQGSLSFIVGSYSEIANWRAVIERLVTFRTEMEAFEEKEAQDQIVVAPAPSPALTVDGLDLALPTGRPLIENVAFTVNPGESVLVTGASGSGKSTLFRALAGIWPFGKGKINIPRDAKVMFLPQKPYMPLGTLAEALSYPESPNLTTPEAKRQALIDCGMKSFAGRLDEIYDWAQTLSPGEQQRIAFARVLLKKPNWVFLDEATSAVDQPIERMLYAKLKDRLPGITVISIAHRKELAEFHSRHAEVSGGETVNRFLLSPAAGIVPS